MTAEDRKRLRVKLLQELYDHHFNSNGLGKQLDKHGVEKDHELNLAYQYLEEKNLISIKYFGGSIFYYKITSYGIDSIESSKVKSDVFFMNKLLLST